MTKSTEKIFQLMRIVSFDFECSYAST